MRNFDDITTYPPLLREMADDIEQCLAEKNQEKLLGCLAAICFVFKIHILPAIFAKQKAWAERRESRLIADREYKE